MRKICLLITAFVMLAWSSVAFAQNVKVSGVVTDASSGEAVPFASVMVKGSMTGTSTNAEGHYSITVPKDGILVFSFMGYISQEVAVGNKAVINVKLEVDQQQLDETIVVAFGTATKESFTGSASVIKSESRRCRQQVLPGRLKERLPEFSLPQVRVHCQQSHLSSSVVSVPSVLVLHLFILSMVSLMTET